MEMPLLFIPAGVTFLLVTGRWIWSERAADARLQDGAAPQPTLAADNDSPEKPADAA